MGMILPQADSRRHAPRRLQPACLASAALAGRRAHQPRHHGRRRARPACRSCGSTEGLDTGPVCLEARVAIGRDMTAGELHDALAASGATLHGAGSCRRWNAARSTAGRKPKSGVHLRREDRAERDAHRLVAAGAGGARQDPRPLALSRRLVRGRDRRQARADQGAPLDLGGGLGRARRRCSTIISPSPAARAPCASPKCSAPAGRPMTADEFLRGVPLRAGTLLR